MPTTPIRLTDSQLNAIFAASHPLQPNQRNQFLEACAQALARLTDPGDGDVFRVVMATQRKFFDPPDFASDTRGAKYTQKRARPRRDDDSEDDRPHKKVQPRTLGAL